jgi:ribonuclease-3
MMTNAAKRVSGSFGSGPGPSVTIGSLSLSNNISIDDLNEALGHAFNDVGLLKRALTHASTQRSDNERLEFLGDRVLGLAIAEMLMREFPGEREGPLSKRLHVLVSMETCAAVAQRAGLGQHLILSAGEERAGGRNRPVILGDVCEAVIAALYLDGGLGAAQAFIERYWKPLLANIPPDQRDAKGALQEWAQARALGIPSYRLIKREGPDHALHYTVEVRIDGHEPAQGDGSNLRTAEQAAARMLMARLNV